MKRSLLRLWRALPMWVHVLVMRLYRARFRVSVAALVFDRQGGVLLFRHTYRKFEWGIPAGGLEYDEQPNLAILREFFEETGLRIEIDRLLYAESTRDDPRNISLIYLCTIGGGEFRESSEISEMRYFDVNHLPPMLFAEKDLIRRAAKELEII